MTTEPEYKILTHPTEEIKELLRNTVYGTKGFRYSHMDTDEKTDHLVCPDFHTLWMDTELAAVAAYCQRNISDGNGSFYTGYYIRYFSVAPQHQGKGFGKLLTKKLEAHYRSMLTEKAIFYAYIEQKNARSLAVSGKFDQENIGAFKSILFSRFFPKKSSGFQEITAQSFITLAKNRYSNHALFHTNKLGYKQQCFGIEHDGEIVVAIQANPVKWKIHNIPGALGWAGRNIIHFLPVIGRLSPRSKFEFVAFEGLVVQPGFESMIAPLMESCLAHFGHFTAMAYFDLLDPQYDLFFSQRMGLMRKLQNPPPVAILCNFLNFQEEEKEAFYTNPKYISCFDLT